MLDFPWWEGDLAGKVLDKDSYIAIAILFTLKTLMCPVQFRCCAVTVPHGISPRSTFSQTAVGRYVAVRIYGSCPSML